jgi:magnesium-transporting ATPase (P-type)
MAFLVCGWTSILNIFNVRSRKSMFLSDIKGNSQLTIYAWGTVFLFALLVLIPPVGNVFGLAYLGWEHWQLAIGLSIVPLIGSEIGKFIALYKEKREYKGRFVTHTPRG